MVKYLIFLRFDFYSKICIFFFQEKFELTFEDFLEILDEPWTSIANDRQELEKAFDRFNHTKDGFIDIEYFRKIMHTLGEPLLDDEIDDIIQLGLNDEHRKIDIQRKNFMKIYQIFN